MMLTMFPFPNFVSTRISLQLQLISSKLGIWMVHLYGMSAYREGNVIDLGFTQLQVVEACSGLRYLIPIMVLSLLLAYFFRGSSLETDRAFCVIHTPGDCDKQPQDCRHRYPLLAYGAQRSQRGSFMGSRGG